MQKQDSVVMANIHIVTLLHHHIYRYITLRQYAV